jgi:FkbM family methyltransferase
VKPPAPDQYFPRDLLRPRPDEAFVDGGAFDGDTLRTLGPNFGRAWAVEPDPGNASRLRAAADPRVTVCDCALGAAPGEAPFSSDLGISSALSDTGGIRVRVETLDRLLAGQSPTFLKLDIEGAEQAALEGAAELLGRTKPTVAVCVYHRPDDLWKIPQLLRRLLPGHRLFLRAHQVDGYELVAYAIPPERLP